MMGQFNTIHSSPRVPFDEKGDNGLILCDKYVPVELLIKIFDYVDFETLKNCQLVCKRWKMLMISVWHRKTDLTLGKRFPRSDTIPWSVYYFACTKKPYERNLIRNPSGEECLRHWDVVFNGGRGDDWKVEEPPIGVPELPQTEPMFRDRQTCFVTSFHCCYKHQSINLYDEGIHPYILNTYQPPIVVSEWYSCRWDCPAKYELDVKLIGNDEEQMDEFKFKEILEGEKQNQWMQVSHVFENYGYGLRFITYKHGGHDRLYWAGHYGCKTAGACITVKIPENICTCTPIANS